MADPRVTTPREMPRDSQTRAAEARMQVWKPVGSLPTVPDKDGFTHRWVRIASKGQPDEQNFYNRLQGGWEPCPRSEYPELARSILIRKGSDFGDNIELGGLLLCRRSAEMTEQEVAYINTQTDKQVRSVNKQSTLRQEVPTATVSIQSQATIRNRDGDVSVANG